MKPAEFKKRRNQMQLSQKKIGDALGLSWRQIVRYEQGDAEIPRTVELALDSLESSGLFKNIPQKRTSIGKRPNKRANGVRKPQVSQTLRVPQDSEMRSGRNTYTVLVAISLGSSPFSDQHLKAGLQE